MMRMDIDFGKPITAAWDANTTCGRAFEAFRTAFEYGETANFLALVTDDFRFSVPLPYDEWKEPQFGRQRFIELVQFEKEVLQVALTPQFQLFDSQYGVVVFRAEGLLSNQPYHNVLTVVFEFEDERIRSFHEFVGMPLKNY
ncbi:ketosteroid isomerase-like protein [Paenibacillus favisporus]|uniref:Ketosteroid isomerase-like protein n=1 Tax=Paenibacillus favisporus TaxID=221028 RepID=A0ABV2F5A1_9BACL